MKKTFLICLVGASLWALQDQGLYDFSKDIHYTSVNRGDLIEEIFAPKEAIEAVQRGENLPLQTTLTLVEYKGSKARLNRTIFMRKTNSGWVFEEFNAQNQRSANDTNRCLNCHRSLKGEDIVFTLDEMKAFSLQGK